MTHPEDSRARTWERPTLRRVTTKITAGGAGASVDLETGSQSFSIINPPE